LGNVAYNAAMSEQAKNRFWTVVALLLVTFMVWGTLDQRAHPEHYRNEGKESRTGQRS